MITKEMIDAGLKANREARSDILNYPTMTAVLEAVYLAMRKEESDGCDRPDH